MGTEKETNIFIRTNEATCLPELPSPSSVGSSVLSWKNWLDTRRVLKRSWLATWFVSPSAFLHPPSQCTAGVAVPSSHKSDWIASWVPAKYGRQFSVKVTGLQDSLIFILALP